MLKAITIGYPSLKDKGTHQILYSGDDRDAARRAAEDAGAKGFLLVEIADPSRILKRYVHEAPTAMVAPAPTGPVVAVDGKDYEQPTRRKRR